MKLGQKSVKNLVGLLRDLKTPKFHSEINWPLPTMTNTISEKEEGKLPENSTIIRFFRFWSLLPCPFTGPKMFCASPNFFVSYKINLHTYCAGPKPKLKDDLHIVNSVLVPSQKYLEWHWMQFQFWSGQNFFWLAQNVLGPVEGQGINTLLIIRYS